jgi:membrane-associated phospholipid phosphatase
LGVYPTVWIEKFINPFLTELMYIFYFLYFPIPLILLGLMYKNSSLKKIEEYIIVYLVCYYGAYLSYFIFPVHGPRFYLADIQNVKLEGLYFTSLITGVIDLVEKNKLDCFPSLHTSILLVTLYLSYFYSKKLFYIYLPLAFGILISLIYCRYHYFIDIIAGFIWAVLSVYLGKFSYNRLSKNFIFHFGEENRYEQ